MSNKTSATQEERELAAGELDTDHVHVRSLRVEDLDAIVRIDRQATGRNRGTYYEGKVAAALQANAVHTSLVAELDDHVVGFMIARVYYGEFGRSEPTAIVDSIGVDRGYQRRKVGDALMRQLLMNLRALGVEHLESLVDWDQQELMQFFAHHDFKPAPRLCLRLSLLRGGSRAVGACTCAASVVRASRPEAASASPCWSRCPAGHRRWLPSTRPHRQQRHRSASFPPRLTWHP